MSGGVLVGVLALLWRCIASDTRGLASRLERSVASDAVSRRLPDPAGIAARDISPANTRVLPRLDPETVRAAAHLRLAPEALRLSDSDDAAFFGEAIGGSTAEAIPQVAKCLRKYYETTSDTCVARFSATYVSTGDPPAPAAGSYARVAALTDRSSSAPGVDDFPHSSDDAKKACADYRTCVAGAILGTRLAVPSGMREASAWSSAMSPAAAFVGEDITPHEVGDDLDETLATVLETYRDAQPWLAEPGTYEELVERGLQACREEFAHLGDEGTALIEVCCSNVGPFAMQYLLRKAMSEAGA